MAEPSVAIHTAIFDALVAGVTAPVYDRPPHGKPHPFVEMTRQVVTPRGGLNDNEDDRFIYLAIWSDTKGQDEALGIMAEIADALHNAKLTLSTGVSVLCRVTDKRTVLDADGVTYQGAVTVHCITAH